MTVVIPERALARATMRNCASGNDERRIGLVRIALANSNPAACGKQNRNQVDRSGQPWCFVQGDLSRSKTRPQKCAAGFCVLAARMSVPLRHSEMRLLAQARNPYSRWGLWIPRFAIAHRGSRKGAPRNDGPLVDPLTSG